MQHHTHTLHRCLTMQAVRSKEANAHWDGAACPLCARMRQAHRPTSLGARHRAAAPCRRVGGLWRPATRRTPGAVRASWRLLVDQAWAVLLVLCPRHPHLLERSQRRQDGPANPHAVSPLHAVTRGHHLWQGTCATTSARRRMHIETRAHCEPPCAALSQCPSRIPCHSRLPLSPPPTHHKTSAP